MNVTTNASARCPQCGSDAFVFMCGEWKNAWVLPDFVAQCQDCGGHWSSGNFPDAIRAWLGAGRKS